MTLMYADSHTHMDRHTRTLLVLIIFPPYRPTSPTSVVDISEFIQLLFKSLLLPQEPIIYPPTVVKRQEGPWSPSPFSLRGLIKGGVKLATVSGLCR